LSLARLHDGLRLQARGIVLPLVSTAEHLAELGLGGVFLDTADENFEDEELFDGLLARCSVHARYVRDGDAWRGTFTIAGVSAGEAWEERAATEADQLVAGLAIVLGPPTGARSWRDERVAVFVSVHESGYWSPLHYVRLEVAAR